VPDLVQAIPAMTAAFLASLVEGVEALTIVLAVASVRGWRPALLGVAAGLVLLVLIVVTLGPLLSLVPLDVLQLLIGVLLIFFGLSWLRKAVLRSAGRMPLHDEVRSFNAETAELREQARKRHVRLDWLAGVSAFKAVLLEGIEVVLFVIAISAGHGSLLPASVGAIAACVLVAILGYVVHRPLSRVPENLLKFAVGVMVLAFGIFWFGEGMGVAWPGEDLAILALMAIVLALAWAATLLLRRQPSL
jgi:uncharacterized membrane protein